MTYMPDIDPVADLDAYLDFDPESALIDLDRHLVATGGLSAFMRLAWPIIEGGEASYHDGWHIDAIAEHLMAVSSGEIRRLAMALPPRHMKSLSAAVAWPAYDWIKRPWRRFLFASYAHNLSIRDSVKCRRLIQSPWYQARWGHRFKLTGDQNTKIRFENDKNGYRIATSVDGQLTGEGADIIVCLPGDEIVWTELGPIEIERIVRDRMEIRAWSYNTATGEVSLKPIVGWHINPGRPVVRVTLSDGSTFRCTVDHLIWTQRGWVQAGRLVTSDVLPDVSLLDLADQLGISAISATESAHAFRAGEDTANDLVIQFRSGMRCSVGPVTLSPDAFGGVSPRMATSDLLNGSGGNAHPGADDLGDITALDNLDSLCPGKDCAGAPLLDGKCAMPLGVLDVLSARAVLEITQASIGRLPVLMANLLAGRDGADKSLHHDLMHEELDRLSILSRVETRIAVARGRFHNTSSNSHRLPTPQDDSRLAANAPHVGNRVVWEAGDRSPVLVEVIDHPAKTFCITVDDWHTMLVGRGQVITHQCDDPHNVRKAESEKKRESTTTWWDESMSTRLNNPKEGAFVLIQQRVHEKDLMGHVLRKATEMPYTVLCMPAEFEPDHPQRWFRDPRKEVGELLWPAHMGRAEVNELKNSLGPYGSAGQLQQRPAPREGGIFKRRWFGKIKVIPADTMFVRGWDNAATEKTLIKTDPDYTAGVKVGYSPSAGYWIIADVIRFRLEPQEVEAEMKRVSEADGTACEIQIKQDPGSAGKKLAQDQIRMLGKFSVYSETVSGDKMANALTWAGKAGIGLVKLLENDNWNDDFLSELCSFPTGAHDDQVDAASAAFDRLLNNTMGIIAFMEAQLKAAGVDPAALRTPMQELEAKRAAEEAEHKEKLRLEFTAAAEAARAAVAEAQPDIDALARAMLGSPPST